MKKQQKTSLEFEDYIFINYLKPIYQCPEFHKLVDIHTLVADNIFKDYREKIKPMMSLQIILWKYANGKYSYLKQIFKDMDMISSNHKSYFTNQSEVSGLLDRFQQYTRSMKSQLVEILRDNDIDTGDHIFVDSRKIDIQIPYGDIRNGQIPKEEPEEEEPEEERFEDKNQIFNNQQVQQQQQLYQMQYQQNFNQMYNMEDNGQLMQQQQNQNNNNGQDQQQQQQLRQLEEEYELEELIYNELLSRIYNNKHSEIFQVRVDDTQEGLERYYEVVQQPMYLDRIFDKLQKGDYINIKQVLDDLWLIQQNCIKFNGEDNEYTTPLIKRFKQFVEKSVKRFIGLCDKRDIQYKSRKIKSFDEFTLLTPNERVKAMEEKRQLDQQDEQENGEKKDITDLNDGIKSSGANNTILDKNIQQYQNSQLLQQNNGSGLTTDRSQLLAYQQQQQQKLYQSQQQQFMSSPQQFQTSLLQNQTQFLPATAAAATTTTQYNLPTATTPTTVYQDFNNPYQTTYNSTLYNQSDLNFTQQNLQGTTLDNLGDNTSLYGQVTNTQGAQETNFNENSNSRTKKKDNTIDSQLNNNKKRKRGSEDDEDFDFNEAEVPDQEEDEFDEGDFNKQQRKKPKKNNRVSTSKSKLNTSVEDSNDKRLQKQDNKQMDKLSQNQLSLQQSQQQVKQPQQQQQQQPQSQSQSQQPQQQSQQQPSQVQQQNPTNQNYQFQDQQNVAWQFQNKSQQPQFNQQQIIQKNQMSAIDQQNQLIRQQQQQLQRQQQQIIDNSGFYNQVTPQGQFFEQQQMSSYIKPEYNQQQQSQFQQGLSYQGYQLNQKLM